MPPLVRPTMSMTSRLAFFPFGFPFLLFRGTALDYAVDAGYIKLEDRFR